jgi:antitoxin VapB
MRQTSIRSDEVANLLDEIVEKTGESKVDAVRRALEMRAEELRNRETSDRALAWLRSAVWPRLPDGVRGRAPTKEEQEDLLGYP